MIVSGATSLLIAFTRILCPSDVTSNSEPGGTVNNGVAVPVRTTVSLTDPAGAGNDTLSITGILNGARDTGATGHVTGNNQTAGFAVSTDAPGPIRTLCVPTGAAGPAPWITMNDRRAPRVDR